MIYYISDLHLGHFNIINMCDRPYSDVEQMNEDLINKWNNRVKKNDTIYFLGDFSMKLSNEKSLEYLKRLNGIKYFIKGNHDKNSFLEEAKRQNLINDYFDYKEINDNGRFVILCHYPLVSWNGMYRNSYHLYGHVHQNIIEPVTRRYCVCVEVNNYEPVTLNELIQNQEIRRAN